ncbi:hypothetical protein GCM10017786_54040 [Amycolatopsis deserti]|uniref:HTH cro/C1-type domain-containing protein n=1 Tax=Amycolatopsis deserti TaxID=185696 RepID=A0ABQ3J9M5_9PSEU|nr:helix-turn-helix transcriptional regulator [Amycolatopsis deserti]GHF13230.1 hypothetical protein GCM10017786_54040 [Amycolatopsis deserti]
MTSEFGALLRQWRRRAGLTQEQLAERAGVGVRSIRGFETGERGDPRLATVRLLADALRLAPAEHDSLLAAAGGPAPRPAPKPPDSAVDRVLADTADELAQAVATRWRREEEQRQVQDPFPLPVRWQPAPDALIDHWANIHRAPPGGDPGPLPLAGRLDEVVDVYRRIPSGRLVVLGRAGSGKTILTLRFVLDLLAGRGRGDPVPVIFGLGSWDPAATDLRDWLTDQLLRDFPGLAAAGPGGPSLAATLVGAGRILPVLDGFDEIAHGLRRAALRALNATTLPLLLTSRPDEYAEAVAATDVLTAAAAVELCDLTAADPGELLKINRTTVLLQALVFAPTFGVTLALGGVFVVGLLEGSLGPLVFGRTGALLWGFVGGIGGALAYVLGLTAWGRWVVFARIWLPLTGRLPWAVSDFLDDAYRRGVLRRSGAVYQFRHARLHDHLSREFAAR